MVLVADEFNGKKAVDEVSGWLRLFDDGTVDRTWTGPPSALFLTVPVPPFNTPTDGITMHDLAGDPPLRVYLPNPPPPNHNKVTPLLPVLLHFHGGGFCITHASWFMYYQFYSRLAVSIPAVIVSVELPLAPEQRLPAAIDASFTALLSLRSLARSQYLKDSILGRVADFSRVFLIGDSSGGNLVHEVAGRAGTKEEGFWWPLRVAGCIPLQPGFVRPTRSRSELEVRSDSAFLTLDMLDKFLALALPKGSDKGHPYTCPMGEAAPPLEGLRLPPFMVAVAEGDLMRDTELEYCEAMKRAGKEVEVVMSSGVGHSFYLNKIAIDSDPTTAKRTEELIEAIRGFVERH